MPPLLVIQVYMLMVTWSGRLNAKPTASGEFEHRQIRVAAKFARLNPNRAIPSVTNKGWPSCSQRIQTRSKLNTSIGIKHLQHRYRIVPIKVSHLNSKALKPIGIHELAGVTTFSQDIADLICERLAAGESLRSICDDVTVVPSMSTVFKWLRDFEPFSQQYARAREAQADTLADDILSIADDGRNDWMAKYGKDEAGWQENGESLRRSQLRIDSRKWLAGKMKPKKYGEKLDLTHAGKIETVRTLSDADLEIIATSRSAGVVEKT